MNVYRIGVALAMTSNHGAVLGVLARDLLGIHGLVGKNIAQFGKLKLAIGGALAVGAGVGIIATMGKMLDKTKDLTREQGKLAAAGLTTKQVADATAKAWQMATTIRGTRVSENLAAIAHLRAVLGSLPEAERIAGGYQRNAVALGAMTGRDGEQQAYQIAQAIHLSGRATNPTTKALDPDKFTRQMNLYTAMIAAGGGKLSSGDLLSFQKQAGSYGSSLTDEGRTNLVGLIQAMGGSKAGTQLSSLNRALKDGILQKATLAEFERVGLIDPSRVRKLAGRGFGGGASPGGGVQFLPGALSNESLFREDLAKWVWTVMVPKLRAAGITDTSDQVNWVQHAKLTANPSRILAELIRNQGVDQQEAANVRLARGKDQYSSVMGRDYDLNKKALKDAWDNVIVAFATPMVPVAIHAMQAVTSGMQKMTAWANAHPEAVRIIGKTLIVVAGGLIALGGAAVGVAAFAALAAGGEVAAAVAGVAAIVGAVTAFAVVNWPSAKAAAQHFREFIAMMNPANLIPHFETLTARDAAALNAKAKTHPWQKPDNKAGDKILRFGAPKNSHFVWTPTPFMPFNGFYEKNSAAPKAPPPAAHKQPANVYLDGKKVGQVIQARFNRDADRASINGASGVDPGMTASPVGLSYV